jgi:glutathione S-transferase
VLADGVCDAFVLYFFERKRAEDQRSQPWIERQLRKIHGGIDEIGRLVPKQGYCVGDRFGLADIAAGCVVGYLSARAPEIEWQPRHPHLLALYDRLMQRESFSSTVPSPQQIEAGVV